MNVDITDLRSTTLPKSTQLNADQLIVGPMDLTITDVRIGADEKQPIAIHYENEAGRPFLPCLSMRRVLLAAWGHDGREWIGKSLRVFHDPQVRFGGDDVGGVRISHMTDIPGKRIELKLTATRGKKVLYTIERMEARTSGPTLKHVLQLISTAANKEDMKAARAAAETLTDPDEGAQAVAAYNAKVNAQREKAAPKPKLADFTTRIDEAPDAEVAKAAVDEAAKVLNDADMAILREQFDIAWKELPGA
ncbi:MAG: hypothetical protein EBR82_09700 [Caulobacteraceae bacterium]|nr:hypothetical protein [Caulobacteraceae bacterium]